MHRLVTWASTAAQVAVLVLAVTLTAAPSLRTPVARQVFDGLFLLLCGQACWEAYRRGHLRRTPRAIPLDVQPRGSSASPLQIAAFYVGIIAAAVIQLT
jgi:hypothetical protein